MYSKIMTCVLIGLNGYEVEAESHIATGLPSFTIVGLPDTSIKESKERVRSALSISGYKFPLGRITINLAPANLKKEGSQMDLAIGISILSAMKQITGVSKDTAFIGELSLDGRVVFVDGVLPMVISLMEKGFKKCIVPYDNRNEAGIVEGIEIIPVKTLRETVDYLNEQMEIFPYKTDSNDSLTIEYDVDFSEIRGQEKLKRAMEIAAAGSHNLLMIGPPGSGKTMAALRFPTILPNLSFKESIECTKIYSISGLNKGSLVTARPFRAPHHSASAISLIGGGKNPKPGEVSLAHNGVLFLDELPEFNKSTIEILRQPIEEGVAHISRVNSSVSYPANFMLITGMNPCPCGNYGDSFNECICSPGQIQKYLGKVSGPILDRIDIHIEVKRVKYKDFKENKPTETSSDIKKRVIKARKIQKERFRNDKIETNSQMSQKHIKKYIKLSEKLERIIEMAYDKYKFSARSFNKILKLSRTIADLKGSDEISSEDLLEAIRFRNLDKKYWGY